jgi:hypothetical protein
MTKPQKTIGWFLILLGATAVSLCRVIVFPGLERLVGIETIVGKENVVYLPDGGYVFTNPGAMFRWVSTVAVIGIIICFIGIRLVARASRDGKSQKQPVSEKHL